AGANLNLILDNAYRQDWKAIERMTRTMQDILQGLRFAPFPVIAAPYGLVLGGGYETIGACDRVVAAAELYCGLVEVGVGLIPGAGGNLRMLLKLTDKMRPGQTGPFPVVMKAFEAIGFARVSSSAKEAQALGYLTRDDKIIVNRDRLLYAAKQEALAMAEGYAPPEYRKDIILPGHDGKLVMQSSIRDFAKAGKISEHDGFIADKLAHVLTGGDRGGLFTPVDEQYLLDIEREAFLSLCAEKKSLDRIAFMLKNGKPLRN
nr:enoyl-CoA hydratase/isomerase family protein [FCB group bacterium]